MQDAYIIARVGVLDQVELPTIDAEKIEDGIGRVVFARKGSGKSYEGDVFWETSSHKTDLRECLTKR